MNTVTKIFALSIASSVGIFASIAETHAANVSAASCSYSDVSSAVTSAAVGDTITVPAGSCTWSSTLNINKGISLIGAGVGKTVITSSASGFLISYMPASPSTNALFRVSGFTFDLGGGSRSGIDMRSGNTLVLQTKVRIDNNRFQNIAQGTTQYMFIHTAGIRGVVDNNYFTSATYMARANGNFDPGQSFWNNHEGVVFGQADNNLWFEDNVINVEAGGGVVDCIEGLRYAFRYNTINVPTGNQMFDLHGNNGPGDTSCFGGELYGNNMVGGTSGQFLDQRGGRFFVFNNNFAGSGWNINVREEQDDNQTPLGTYVGPGTRYPQHVSGTYNWGNRANLTGSLVPTVKGSNCIGSVCYNTPMPVAGQDFFTESTSTGISCGTLANRPSSCTTNQGYWATNQSCTNLTGMVGANPATPIAGTLYTCKTTNTWDSGHVPLPYPHPLRGTVSAPSAVPNAPFLHLPIYVQ
ncbi:MAG TPA: hypothetical protein VIF37_17225 [Methylobacter sp.]|jgi:hypothetical protein